MYIIKLKEKPQTCLECPIEELKDKVICEHYDIFIN